MLFYQVCALYKAQRAQGSGQVQRAASAGAAALPRYERDSAHPPRRLPRAPPRAAVPRALPLPATAPPPYGARYRVSTIL